MVFKARERLGEARGNASAGGFGSHLADGTVLHAGRGGIEQADAVDDAAGGAEGLTQDLQASTNGKDRAAGVGGAAQATIGNQVVRGQDLRGIFAAAEGVDIQRFGHGLA